jgi:hypothetical protein
LAHTPTSHSREIVCHPGTLHAGHESVPINESGMDHLQDHVYFLPHFLDFRVQLKGMKIAVVMDDVVHDILYVRVVELCRDALYED